MKGIIHIKNKNICIYLLLISMSCSTDNSFPDIGSIPFSTIYFSIRRFSKIAPDTGETTGCSGTSLDTVGKCSQISILSWRIDFHYNKEI